MKSDGDEKRHKALQFDRPVAVYDVGYGKPPATTRFKAGQSGNPRGRPKGSSNKAKMPALNEERMKSILLEEAYRTIKVNEGAGQISVPMAQAVIRSLAVNAAKGNQRAQRLFTELLFTTERENKTSARRMARCRDHLQGRMGTRTCASRTYGHRWRCRAAASSRSRRHKHPNR